MGLMTEENFDRYVAQHDAAQERFFKEHNGCLQRLEDGQRELKELVVAQHAETKALIQAETAAREDCAADCETRLQALEAADTADVPRADVTEHWRNRLAWFLGIIVACLAIATFVITLVR